MFCYTIIMSIAYFWWKAVTFSAILKTMMILRQLGGFVLIWLKKKKDFYWFYDWGPMRRQNTELIHWKKSKNFMPNVVH